MSKIIGNRSELLFLYDIKDANPNGDPMDENKPRIDEETDINIVTDVRLKRTVRDYFIELIEQQDQRLEDQDVFIREVRDKEGFLYDAKTRAKDFLKSTGSFAEMKKALREDICKKCIDIRLFGAVIPIDLKVEGKSKSGSIHLIGPVQFRMGRSLHRVIVKFIKGTGAFASDYSEKKSMQRTFREEYILPYSLISFYGIVNENAAEDTLLMEDDIELLMEGLWNGTKNKITRSKFGQMPRFLLRVVYKEKNFYIGNLDKKILPEYEKDDIELRDVSEITLNVIELLKTLRNHKEKIEYLELKIDDSVKFRLSDEKEGNAKELKSILNQNFNMK